METFLDNPAWGALNSYHASFEMGTARAKRYRPGVVPFVGFGSDEEGVASDLDPWMAIGEAFYIIGQLPVLPTGWVMEHALPCWQMMGPGGIVLANQEGMSSNRETGGPTQEIVSLSDSDSEEMFALINSVQPGYYERGTRLMGNYYGIRREGKLVAMAGERLRLTGFSEISAVCTHPAYTGRQYAQQLIAHISRLHSAGGIRTFLHVAKSNERAVRLYQYLGFGFRRDITFWRVRKNGV
jgi:ribosomal protein S18 acetylase RimI-like enzyme